MMVPIFLILLSEMIKFSTQSITGLTYMDDYDFETRYRDVNECDPSYWHPLHLPEECAKMFEKLIRNQIPNSYPYPVRVLTDDERRNPSYHSDTSDSDKSREKKSDSNYFDVMSLSGGQTALMSLDSLMNPSRAMYDGLIKQLTKEAVHTPVAATFAVIPPLGPVALYRQPVSRTSEKLITKWARRHTFAGDMNENTRRLMYFQQIPKGEGNVEMIKDKFEQFGNMFMNPTNNKS